MNKKTSDMIKLVYSGITNKSIDASNIDEYDWLITVASQHRCMTILYYALNNNGIILERQLYDTIEKTALNEVVISEQQLFCIGELSEIFNANGIEHMFLKGSVLKTLYPHPEIRRMGDIDVLIKDTQYRKISQLMQSAKYTFEYESDYEIVWKKGYAHIELHRVLIPAYNKDLYKYFGNGWKRAFLKEQSCYSFSDEDMFVYTFSHFAKHFRDAGIGIIHMCDLYVLLNSYDLNFEYIDTELKQLQLYDFWHNIKDTIDVWFSSKESTEITDCITSIIFNSGVYGLKERSNISKALKSEKNYRSLFVGKIYRLIHLIFPIGIIRKYKVLRVFPFLLPVFWVYRWINILATQRKKIKSKISDISAISKNDVQEYHKLLKHIGLDYNF